MADINKMYKDLINDLDKNIKDENELKNIKEKMFDIMTYFLDSSKSIINIKDRQEKLDKNIKKLQKRIERIEEDIYIEDYDEYDGDRMHDNDYEFEIRCPYCDEDFIISSESKSSSEIECPHCHNVIELDWNEESECDGCCSKCKEQCYEEDEEQDVPTQVKEEETSYNPQEQNNNTNNNNTKKESNNDNKKNEDDM